jgi:hypothetical protein
MESKHTPGDWSYTNVSEEKTAIAIKSTNAFGYSKIIASVWCSPRKADDTTPVNEAKANAKLMAAAPELLEVLKATLVDIQDGNDMEEALIQIKKIIAKATE